MSWLDKIGFRRSEPKEDRNYSDRVTELIVQMAEGESPGTTSAVEIAAGVIARAFASATVTGPGAALLDPDALFTIGRDITVYGASAWKLEGDELYRLKQHDYRDGRVYVDDKPLLPASALYIRYISDPLTGKGVSAIDSAVGIKTLLSRLELSIAKEAAAAVGYLLPIPSTSSDSFDTLRDDLQELNGRIAIIETERAGYGQGLTQGARNDYALTRLGINTPQQITLFYRQIVTTVLGLYGIPLSLVDSSGEVSQRESWRMFMHGTLTPLGVKVEASMEKIGNPVTISFDRLFASDISGRARGFQSMVKAGMDIDEAARLTGLLAEEE